MREYELDKERKVLEGGIDELVYALAERIGKALAKDGLGPEPPTVIAFAHLIGSALHGLEEEGKGIDLEVVLEIVRCAAQNRVMAEGVNKRFITAFIKAVKDSGGEVIEKGGLPSNPEFRAAAEKASGKGFMAHLRRGFNGQ